MSFNKVEIIVSEIDGIITNGSAPIAHMNNVLYKNYCLSDFEAIHELKSYFTFVFLSSDSSVSYNIMRLRNIPAYFTTHKEDKLTILTKKILPRYNTRPDNLLYIGSMGSDIPCMNLASVNMSSESSIGINNDTTYKIPVVPGNGVISYVANVLRAEIAERKFKE